MLIGYKQICFSLLLGKITSSLLPQMPARLRSFPRTNSSEDVYTTLIANALSWLSGKGQNMRPLGTGGQFTDSSTTSLALSTRADTHLSDGRLWTPWEHNSSNTSQSSLERLRIPIPGSARTAATTAVPLLSKSSLQIKGLLQLSGMDSSAQPCYQSLLALLCDLSSATISSGIFKEHHLEATQADYQGRQWCVSRFCLCISHRLNVPLAKCFPATSYLLSEMPFLTSLRP